MNLAKILSALRLELKEIDQAIRSLERLAVSNLNESKSPKEDERTVGKTILVLEDGSLVLALLLAPALSMLKNYTMLRATNAGEALQLFVDHDCQLDLLVADVTVPTNSSIQLALLLRSKIRHLPVILTSAHPVSGLSDEDSAALKRLGANLVTILQKPFPAQALSKAVLELTALPQPEKTRSLQAGDQL